MANSDKRQAALDAVQDILKARAAAQAGGGMSGGPGGSVDIDVDPELDTPTPDIDAPSGNIEINDPDNVLDQKEQRQQGKQGGGSSKQNQGGQKGDKGQQGGSQGGQQGGSQSGSQGGSEQGNDGQSNGEKKDGQDQDSNGGGNGDEDDNTPEKLKKSGEYIKDWNDAIDKYDNDETSNSELEQQMNDKNNSQGTRDACAAIRTSRDRKLEIDPSTDQRLKMPKNSEEKTFDDSDDETEEERHTRVGKIQQEFDDAEQVEKDLQDIETDIAIKKGDAMRAKKKEIDKVAREGQLMDFKDFGVDLFKAIKSQLTQSKTPDD